MGFNFIRKHLSKEYILKHSLWVIVSLFIFSSIAGAHVEPIGDINEALKAAEEIENPKYKASTLSLIAQAQVEALDLDGAKVTFQMALTAAEEIENPNYKSLVLRSIAEAQLEALDLDGIKVTLQMMALEVAEKLEDSLFKASILRDIRNIEAWVKAFETKDCSRFSREIWLKICLDFLSRL